MPTFWFQLVWDLCACGKHAVKFFYLVWFSVDKTVDKTAQKMWLRVLSVALEEKLKVLDYT